jgi:hypothetical protein
MTRILTCLALGMGAWLAMPTPAQAAQSYDNCTGFISSVPATITTQGTWCLDKDLATSMTAGYAITISANNVTIDCNHFKIGGLGAGAGTEAIGVFAWSRLNATVRNCNIRGFQVGLYFSDGGGHLVEDNSFDGNTLYGILVSSFGSTIRSNLVIDTGGSTAATGMAVGIHGANGADILDNTVNGVAPTGGNAYAYGIHSGYNGSVNGNRVRALAPAGTGVAYGIFSDGPGRDIIRGNDVQGPGPSVTGGVGIYCGSNAATTRDNVIAGFETGISTCLSSVDIVNPN